MLNRATAGIDWSDLDKLPRDIDLGFNATGVVQSSLHIEDGQIIQRESMPGHFVQDIMDSVHALGQQSRMKRPGGMLIGQLPITLWYAWRREWARGPKQWGESWDKFFHRRFLDSDYNKFRVRT